VISNRVVDLKPTSKQLQARFYHQIHSRAHARKIGIELKKNKRRRNYCLPMKSRNELRNQDVFG